MAEKKDAKKDTAKAAVPDADARNRAETQTQDDAVTAAARKAAPAVVAAVSDAIKDAAASVPSNEPSGDGTFDTTPTPTQITEEARKPLDPKGTEELKIVRTDNLPGQPTTTLKEELRVVDEAVISGDEEKDANTLAVLAKTQGINQMAGDKIVGQDGKEIANTKDIEGDIPEAAKEAAKG
jgi:hypothetical protein